MYDYFTQTSETRRASIEAAAVKMGVDPIIVEKDLWVTVTLHSLFSNMMPDIFVFKGGTSLSKAYGIIQRFSEDIDVTIDRSIFGSHLALSELSQLGVKERERIIEEINSKAQEYIKTQIMPLLSLRLQGISKQPVEINVSPDDPLSVEVYYPSFFKEKYVYIKPKIYIEFGIRGELEPHSVQVVTSFVHKQISALNDMHVAVKVLSPIRTFYEKATLLHREANRPNDKLTPIRLSRHYYDLHQLANKGYLQEAITELPLLEDVVRHKMLLFKSAEAQYETIFSKGIKLLPPSDRLKDLKTDYKKMEEMFFGPYPSLEEVLSTLEEAERDINIAIEKRG